jgi:DHA1 family tetracycline resistance protein-like MFS transporter
MTRTAPAAVRAGNLNFVLVCIFIDMLGIGLIVPVLPALVGDYVQGRGQQALWYGLLSAVYGVMQFVFMPMVGAVSDRVGRRPMLLYSMAGMCINFLSTAWAPNLACLFIGRVIGGASSANMSVASAYASDVSTPDNRAKSFGKIGAAFGLGFICGPILGGMLGNIGLHLPFYVAAALSAANLVYGFVAVPESLPPERRSALSLARMNPFGALGRLLGRRDIRGLLVVYTLMTFAQMMLQSTFVLFTTFRFAWTPADNGIALFCVGLSSIVVQAVLLGWLIRRLGDMRVALLGLCSGALAFVLYGLVTQGWMIYAVILCNVLSFAAPPALQGILSKASSAREQGELMGSLQSIGSLGLILMPLVGTVILGAASSLPRDDWRVGAAFYLCAAMLAAAIVVARRWFRAHAQADAPAQAQPL